MCLPWILVIRVRSVGRLQADLGNQILESGIVAQAIVDRLDLQVLQSVRMLLVSDLELLDGFVILALVSVVHSLIDCIHFFLP